MSENTNTGLRRMTILLCLRIFAFISIGVLGCGQYSDESSAISSAKNLEAKPENDLQISAVLGSAAEIAADHQEDRNISFLIQNVGQAQSDNVLVVITPPLGAVLNKLTSQQGYCHADGQVPTLYWLCDLGSLQSGASATLLAAVKPSFDNKRNPQTVTAAVTSSAADYTSADNTASVDIFNAYLSLGGGGFSCTASAQSWRIDFNHKSDSFIVLLMYLALLMAGRSRLRLSA
jgi:hypothetical protein